MATVIPERIEYDTLVRFDDGQETPVGKWVGHMYYQTQLTSMYGHDQRSGYPSNGGQHTLSIHDDAEDLLAWLDICEEYCEGKDWITFPEPEIALLRLELVRKDRPKTINLRRLIHDAIQVEVLPEIGKLWVNGLRGNMARITPISYEVSEWDLKSIKASGAKPDGGLNQQDFRNFCEYVRSIHGVRIDKDALTFKE